MDRQRLENIKGDIYLTCADCGGQFTWSEGEQRFYASRDLAPPKRCPDCRRLRRLTVD